MTENLFGFLPDFVSDALIDSIKLIPFLLIIFIFIELFENYFSKKIIYILKYSKKIGPIFGALFAIVPQCGFSIVATLLYLRKFVSVGTLIAVYIATSDEAIPILLAKPDQVTTVGKIIVIKLILAIAAGYLTDLFFKSEVKLPQNDVEEKCEEEEIEHEKGCCNHEIADKKLQHVLLHPLKHTLIIFSFILAVCLALNYVFEIFPQETIEKCMLQGSLLQPVIVGIFGLIPNCAVSVLITLMYLKGVISFGSVIAGLSSGAGLGLLILLKRGKDFKNTAKIIALLLTISIVSGVVIQLF